ncbi:MAG: FAD-dependent thymidylate synthase, partial [Planctomyces sp.]
RVSDDRTLIRYLLRHRHTTPFEMAEIKLLLRVPMDCWRQWVRHRTANINEYSTRYSLAIDAAQTTPADEWRSQAEHNRQGSGEILPLEMGQKLTAEETALQAKMREVYQQRIESGVAREQARKDLPLATYTEAYWKIDLHNLLHFLALRMDSHAQLEIRTYAQTIGEQIVKPLFPVVWEAFLDYRMQSMSLTRLDCEVIQRLHSGAAASGRVPPFTEPDFLEAQDPAWKPLSRSRERDECLEKLIHLGIVRK